jgi:hypothetical protein
MCLRKVVAFEWVTRAPSTRPTLLSGETQMATKTRRRDKTGEDIRELSAFLGVARMGCAAMES